MQRAPLIKRRCEKLPEHAFRLQLGRGAPAAFFTDGEPQSHRSLSRGSRAFFLGPKKGGVELAKTWGVLRGSEYGFRGLSVLHEC